MTDWLTPEQQRIWRVYFRATTQVMARLTRDMAGTDFSVPEYQVLAELSEAPGQVMRMAQLAEVVPSSRSRMTYLVQRLEDNGYVKRSGCTEDRRGVRCQLTAEGMAWLEENAAQHVAFVRARVVDRLTDEEFTQLGRIMEKLTTDIDADPQE